MSDLSRQTQRELDFHLKQVARILYSYTELEKLETFESIEWEVREQLLNQISPAIGNFFLKRWKLQQWQTAESEKLSRRDQGQSETRKSSRIEGKGATQSNHGKIKSSIIKLCC